MTENIYGNDAKSTTAEKCFEWNFCDKTFSQKVGPSRSVQKYPGLKAARGRVT